MKLFPLSLVSLFVMLSFQSCKKDVEYLQKQVKFYSDHPTHILTPTQFETVTEQVLMRESYNEGAFFETLSEQVLKSESYTSFKISSAQEIHFVKDAEQNILTKVDCYDFFNEISFEEAVVPAEYETRSYQKVVQDGTGTFHEATYSTRSYKKVVTDAKLELLERDRSFVLIDLVVPDSLSTAAYIADQLSKHGLDHCELGTSYDIIE